MKMDVPELPEESIINLSQLLSKWRLEFLLRQFIEEKIDEEVLQMIDASHIKVLLNKYPMGVQIRFAHHLNNWRKSIGKPLKAMTFNEFTPTLNTKEVYAETCSVISDLSQTSTIPIDLNGSVSDITILSDNVSTHTADTCWGNLSTGSETPTELHSITNTNNNTGSSSSISNSKPKSKNSSKIDLEEILLNSPPNGPDLIQLYERQKHFTHIDRKRLVSTIVNYYLECKLPLDLGTSYDLENAIMKMFPSETLGMYRNSRQGKIFNRYTREKGKEMESDKLRENGLKDSNEDDLSMYLPNESFRQEEHGVLDAEDGESIVIVDHDVLIQTVFEGQKKFTKIRTPFLYNSFLTTACEMFNIIDVSDYCLFQNGCEIEEDRFKNLIIKFYKSPTFTLELKLKNESLEPEVISNHLPDVKYIRKMPAIIPLLMLYENGKPLQNMHRTTIAKSLIDECLKFNPERILKKADLQILTENICKTFHTEVPSTYFVPCHKGKQARGKLWCAYTNKRKLLCATGLVAKQRNRKRKMSLDSSDHDNEDNNDNAESPVRKRFKESEEFSVHTNLDLETLVCRWEETHEERRHEILQGILSPQEYLLKYSILQSDRGVHLFEMDVKQMHPNMGNMDNWLELYDKVVNKVRDVRKYKHVPKLIEIIDASHDTRYRASLALNLLVYIFTSFPRCSKPEIQNRFLKEYKSMDDLMNDGKAAELQIRFVHQSQRIVYADFTAYGGFTYKFVDLFEAVTHCFHYIMALNLEYPKICQCLWQFVQLAIFQIEIECGKLPQIESTINDLLYVPKD